MNFEKGTTMQLWTFHFRSKSFNPTEFSVSVWEFNESDARLKACFAAAGCTLLKQHAD